MEEKDLDLNPSVPEVPLEAEMVDPNEVEVQYEHMLGSEIGFTRPAQGVFSSICADRLGVVSMKNGLGTDKVAAVVTGFDASKYFFFMIPVAPGTKGSVEVKRDADGSLRINLFRVFSKVNRLVPKGRREYYKMEFTPGKVKVGKYEGYGLYAYLPDVESAPIQQGKTKKKAATQDPNKKPEAENKTGSDTKPDAAQEPVAERHQEPVADK